MAMRAWAAAGLVVMTAAVGADSPPDPWAPGVSAEPWPLIAALQRPGALGGDGAAWQAAFAHADPLVRAAAAWAAGRTRPANASTLLGVSAFDTDRLVRDASLWALVRIDDPAARRHLWRVLGTRWQFTPYVASSEVRYIGEPPAGFGALFRRQGLPVVESTLAERRVWLSVVAPEAVESGGQELSGDPIVRSFDWAAERSEWDASERVSIRAEITVAAGSLHPERPAGVPLQTQLAALDDPDSRPGKPSSIPVHLRGVGVDDRDVARARVGRTETDFQLSLHEVPPGAYALMPFEVGHPLLLRVRRSSRREAAMQAAAAQARTPEEIEASSRQRVAAQADRWRSELAALLETGGSVPTVHLRALARVHDAEAAGMLVDAISGPRRLRDGDADITAGHALVRAFGPIALPHLERAATQWRREIEDPSASPFALSVLTSSDLASPALDEARVAALRGLAPQVKPRPGGGYGSTVMEFRAREGFQGTIVAIAARRPEEAGWALAAIADRPSLLADALEALDPGAFGHHAPDLDSVDAVLAEAWRQLPSATPPDGRAALAAEAERLLVTLPGMEAASPAGAAEAARELQRATPRDAGYLQRPLVASQRTLRRVLASGLAETDGRVAVSASRLARSLGEGAEAARLGDLAVRLLPSFPERAGALWVRAQVFADAGDARRASADLEEALPHLYGPPDPRVQLRAWAATPAALRVRVRQHAPWGSLPVTMGDGRVLVRRGRLVFGGGLDVSWRLSGILPWDAQVIAPVGTEAVALLAHDGRLGLVREGQPGLAWRHSVAPPGWGGLGPPLVADARTVLVRDGEGVVRAFDAGTGRMRWSGKADDYDWVGLQGDGPLVLRFAGHSSAGAVAGFDVRTGRVLWMTGAGVWVQALRMGTGRLAWITRDGTLNEVDPRTGRPLTSLALPPLGEGRRDAALALVPSSREVVVALKDRLLLVDRGQIVWSRPTAEAGRSWAPRAVEVGEDGVIWCVLAGQGPIVEAWTRRGKRLATHELAEWGSDVTTTAVVGRTLVVSSPPRSVLIDRAAP